MTFPLETKCVCGCRFGQHKAVTKGQPIPCKGHNDKCPCKSFDPVEMTELERALFAFEQAVGRDIRESTTASYEAKQEARERYLDLLDAQPGRRLPAPARVPEFQWGEPPFAPSTMTFLARTLMLGIVVVALTSAFVIGSWLIQWMLKN